MVDGIGGDILNYWVKVMHKGNQNKFLVFFLNIGTSKSNMSDDRVRFIYHQL